MPAVIDKALDFINGMNTSASSPEPMDESTAKGILKYLKELGCPASVADITARGEREGWNPGFTQKVVGWAEKYAAGERVLIRDPEYFSLYMREQLQDLVEVERA